MVFDNDASMTFAPFPIELYKGSGDCKIIKKGCLNLPYIDKSLVEHLFSLTRIELSNVLKPYLNRAQIIMCWNRIVSLRKAIRHTNALSDNNLLKPEQWTEETLEQEIKKGQQYGRTYLTYFLNYEKITKPYYDYCHIADL